MTPAETLLEQARQQLTRQEAKLDAIRTLTGVVVTGAGVVSGFIAPALASMHAGYAVPALIAFVVCSVGGVIVLYPRKGLVFSEKLASYTTWVETYSGAPDADEQFSIGLAKSLEAARDENKPVVERIADIAAGVCVVFGLEVVLWVAGLLLAG